MKPQQKKPITIDLSEDLKLSNRSLVHSKLGKQLAEKYNIDYEIANGKKITVILPHYVYNIGNVFFDSMFGYTLGKLGIQDFKKCVTFECDDTNALKSIDQCITWSWDRMQNQAVSSKDMVDDLTDF